VRQVRELILQLNVRVAVPVMDRLEAICAARKISKREAVEEAITALGIG
jgi:hypothetical protein